MPVHPQTQQQETPVPWWQTHDVEDSDPVPLQSAYQHQGMFCGSHDVGFVVVVGDDAGFVVEASLSPCPGQTATHERGGERERQRLTHETIVARITNKHAALSMHDSPMHSSKITKSVTRAINHANQLTIFYVADAIAALQPDCRGLRRHLDTGIPHRAHSDNFNQQTHLQLTEQKSSQCI